MKKVYINPKTNIFKISLTKSMMLSTSTTSANQSLGMDAREDAWGDEDWD